MNRHEIIQKLGEIVFDNNFFETMPGERFKETYGVDNIQAAISFAGRSRKHESYLLLRDSDYEALYITHLYVDNGGHLMVRICAEDDDDFAMLVHPTAIGESVKHFETETLEDWVKLLEY